MWLWKSLQCYEHLLYSFFVISSLLTVFTNESYNSRIVLGKHFVFIYSTLERTFIALEILYLYMLALQVKKNIGTDKAQLN